jgi:flotillin
VRHRSAAELGALGLLVDSFQISSIDDMGSGYIQAMAAPHTAKIQQEAKVAQAEANRASAEAEQELAQKKADLRQQELVGEVVKPAEAEAERTRVQASAEAEAMTVKSTAAASNKRVALDRMLIEQLPEIVEKAAAGLSNANVNILDGADGLANVTAGLVISSVTGLPLRRARAAGFPRVSCRVGPGRPQCRSGLGDSAKSARWSRSIARA